MKQYTVLCLLTWLAIPAVANKVKPSKLVKVHICDQKENGGCEQICEKKGDEAVCGCKEGDILNDDGKTCGGWCHDEEHKCDDGGCIYKGYVCDGIVDCDDGSDEVKCDSENDNHEEKFDDAIPRVHDPPCRVGEKMYKKGAQFRKGCEVCTCFGAGIGCKQVCPKVIVRCDGGRKVVFDKKPVTGYDGCSCNVPRCVMGEGIKKKPDNTPHPCAVGKTLYKNGETFVKDCQFCTCTGASYLCKSMCPVAFVRCDGGQKVVHDKAPLQGQPGCFCSQPRCDSVPMMEINDQISADVITADELDTDIFELAPDEIFI